MALVPVLVLTGVACSGPAATTATYSAGDEVHHSPYSYGGAPRRTGSSTRGLRTAAPVAQEPRAPQPAPYYAPPTAPTYTTPAPASPPPATAYVPPAPTPPPPPPPVPAPMPAPEPTTPPATVGSPTAFIWARSLNEAQALARAQNKLIFLETGRDACGNCQKLRRQTIPSLSTELGTLSVGYYDDCDRDRNSPTFELLYRNLPGAGSLPLVGWVTPDLRWVYGFSGGRDAARFRQDMETARATWRQMSSIEGPRSTDEARATTGTPAR